LANNVIWNIQIPHELIHFLTYMSARLPTAFEAAIETVIADSIAPVDNKAATASIIATADSIETNPTAWGCFTFSWNIL
jgi:hypothetical protein